MKRFGMTIPFDGTPLHAQQEAIRELEALGYTDGQPRRWAPMG